eukprot:5599175-Amphidinium_carterae.1
MTGVGNVCRALLPLDNYAERKLRNASTAQDSLRLKLGINDIASLRSPFKKDLDSYIEEGLARTC